MLRPPSPKSSPPRPSIQTVEELEQLILSAMQESLDAEREIADCNAQREALRAKEEEAERRARQAQEAVHAWAAISRTYHRRDFDLRGMMNKLRGVEETDRRPPSAAPPPQPEPPSFDAANATQVALIVEYMKRHRSEAPFTPKKIAVGLEREFGRRLDNVAVAGVKAKAKKWFKDCPGERGAFDLRDEGVDEQ